MIKIDYDYSQKGLLDIIKVHKEERKDKEYIYTYDELLEMVQEYQEKLHKIKVILDGEENEKN